MKIMQISNTINNQQNKNFKRNSIPNLSDISFHGAYPEASMNSKFFEPVRKFFKPVLDFHRKNMNILEDKMAFQFVKILDTKFAKNVVEKSTSKNLVAHLSAFTSFVLSGFYIKKTLDNDKLDEAKRKTLAINQALTCVFSTICAYTLNHVLERKINQFSDKFLKVNAKESATNLLKYKDGIHNAASIMIFGVIYRFIAPVLATPIANFISNTKEKHKLEQQEKQINSQKNQ